MPKVVNLKTGKVRQMTQLAVDTLKKHKMWKDMDIVPDGAVPPPAVKKTPKAKAVEVIMNETDEKS